ncbi:MAG: export transporter periplasmic protein LptC [Bacteroidota bacterium]|jgi:LPS export ABC transporter protein LptC
MKTRATFIASILIGCISCQNEIAEIKAVTDDFNYPVQSIIDADYIFSERGERSTRLESPLLERFVQDTSIIVARTGFKMTFYDNQEGDAVLTAKTGDFWEKSGVFKANGNVKMINSDQEYMLSESVIFYRDSDLIKTDDWVTIQTKTGILHGKGLVSNAAFTEYQILKPTGQMNLNNNID